MDESQSIAIQRLAVFISDRAVNVAVYARDGYSSRDAVREGNLDADSVRALLERELAAVVRDNRM